METNKDNCQQANNVLRIKAKDCLANKRSDIGMSNLDQNKKCLIPFIINVSPNKT